MTDQPQPLDLDAIEARANNATPGPWFQRDDDWPGRVFSNDQFCGHIARTTGTRPEANAAFIAAARTDVPALLAEIRRLTAELADTARMRDFHARSATHVGRKRDRAEQLIDHWRNGHIDAERVLDRIARTLAVGDDA